MSHFPCRIELVKWILTRFQRQIFTTSSRIIHTDAYLARYICKNCHQLYIKTNRQTGTSIKGKIQFFPFLNDNPLLYQHKKKSYHSYIPKIYLVTKAYPITQRDVNPEKRRVSRAIQNTGILQPISQPPSLSGGKSSLPA